VDPTEALKNLREAAGELRAHPPHGLAAAERVDQVLDGFENLDEWLAKGGFLPQQWRASPGRPPMTEDGEALEGVPHGKRSSYNKGCKERLCRRANTLRRDLTEQEIEELTRD
jgi:hypothetical protein